MRVREGRHECEDVACAHTSQSHPTLCKLRGRRGAEAAPELLRKCAAHLLHQLVRPPPLYCRLREPARSRASEEDEDCHRAGGGGRSLIEVGQGQKRCARGEGMGWDGGATHSLHALDCTKSLILPLTTASMRFLTLTPKAPTSIRSSLQISER